MSLSARPRHGFSRVKWVAERCVAPLRFPGPDGSIAAGPCTCVFACALALRVSVVSGARVRCFLWPGVQSFPPSSGREGSRVRWVACWARVPMRPNRGSWRQSHALWCCATSSTVVAQVTVLYAYAPSWRVPVVSAVRVCCFVRPCVVSFSPRSGHGFSLFSVARCVEFLSEYGTRGLTCEVGRMRGRAPPCVRVAGPGSRVTPLGVRNVVQCGCPSPCVVCLCPGLASVCRICRARLLFSEALCYEFLSEAGTWILSVFCGPVC